MSAVFHHVPPSGGSLEIGNCKMEPLPLVPGGYVPPSGGSLEIGNIVLNSGIDFNNHDQVPPSGGSLEIGNHRIL